MQKAPFDLTSQRALFLFTKNLKYMQKTRSNKDKTNQIVTSKPYSRHVVVIRRIISMTLLADLKQGPTAIIPACGDGHTFQTLANSEAPAIFLSGQLTIAFKHKE